MATITGIYKITNTINNKVYIGSSKDILRRWKEHKKFQTRQHIHCSIQKYGVQNFLFEILETCPCDKFIERENYYMEIYNSKNSNVGYNHSDSCPSSDHKLTTREKLRKINLGKKHSDETKLKCSIAAKKRDASRGSHMSEEHKKKISIGNIGKKMSKESIRKRISKMRANNSFQWKPERYELMSDKFSGKNNPMYGKPSPRRRKVSQIDKDSGKIIKIFDSIKEAGKITNVATPHIIACCQGKQRTTSGKWKWKYVE